jgi:hypothetical protein
MNARIQADAAARGEKFESLRPVVKGEIPVFLPI